MRASIPVSPLAPGVSPVSIHYREHGSGVPMLFLHGGWGYEIYPFDRQIEALAAACRIVIPDRTGYGGSGPIDVQPTDFHRRAAVETLALMDVLGLAPSWLWGHSDGAVIALHVALLAPGRVRGVICEATHFWQRKPRSRTFFETMRDAPDQLGERVATTLKREHGDRWRALISTNGVAWLRIADEAGAADADFYEGRLADVRPRVLLLHGAKDPRTEPGELAALQAALGRALAGIRVLDAGGHSPHSERACADESTAAALAFTRS